MSSELLKAGLPLYDWPEVGVATDRLWAAISKNLGKQGVDAPDFLWRPADLTELWDHPNLLVGQMCGLPFIEKYQSRGQVQMLGSLEFSLDGPLGSYHSVLVCRRGNPAKTLADFAGQRAAINEVGSQSGEAALRQAVHEYGVNFSETMVSGSHRDSIKQIAEDYSDVAAIDAVSWCLALDHEPAAQELRVFQRTTPTPGVALVVANQQAHLRPQIIRALNEALAGLDPEIKSALHLKGFVAREASDYQVLLGG